MTQPRKGKGKAIKLAPKGASLLTSKILNQSADEQKANNADLDQPAFQGMESDSLPGLEKKFKAMLQKQDDAKNLSSEALGLEEECRVILSDHGLSATGYKRGKFYIYIKPGKSHVAGTVE